MVIVEGIEVALVVMIIHTAGLQGDLHIEVAGIIRQGTRHMEGDLGGKGLGLFLILHMVAQTGGMLVDPGDISFVIVSIFEEGWREKAEMLKCYDWYQKTNYGTLTISLCI